MREREREREKHFVYRQKHTNWILCFLPKSKFNSVKSTNNQLIFRYTLWKENFIQSFITDLFDFNQMICHIRFSDISSSLSLPLVFSFFLFVCFVLKRATTIQLIQACAVLCCAVMKAFLYVCVMVYLCSICISLA